MTVSAAPDRLSSPRSGPTSSPQARRQKRSGWRDPRFAVGVVLLCGSVLVGARVFAAADDTVAVWGAGTSLARGQAPTVEDLVPVQVRFTDPASAARYVAASDDLPSGAVLSRDVAAGELLPRAALGDGPDEAFVELPLSVDAAGMPSSVTIGSRVDVWVTPTQGVASTSSGGNDVGNRPSEAVRVLTGVPVVADGDGTASAAGFGGGSLPVVVGVPPSAQDDLPQVLARLGDGTVVLVRRQG